MKKPFLYQVGLFQALGVVAYCSLIALFFNFLENYFGNPPKIVSMIVILSLLVLSVAITGLIVFGYPTYLVLNKKIKEALIALGYTFLFLISLLIIFLLIIL